MKDLYRKLELEPTATPGEIAAALEKHPELNTYSAILLDEDRRSLYDRAHHVLKLIGTLRFQLDLDKSDTRFIEHHSDFAIMPKPKFTGSPKETAGAEAARPGSQGSDRKGRRTRRWLIAQVVVLAAAAATALILTLN